MASANHQLTIRILIALLAGMLLGCFLYYLNSFQAVSESSFFQQLFDVSVNGIAFAGGKIFVASLKVMVVPLVFVSLIMGIANMGSGGRLGVIAIKTLIFYIATTCVAISIALLLGAVIQPGAASDGVSAAVAPAINQPPGFWQVVIDMFPSNIVNAMAEGKMLQVIVFAVLFGIALITTKEDTEQVMSFFQQLDRVIMRMVMILMQLAPYGVFCLVFSIFATLGWGELKSMAWYFVTVVLALLVHGFLTYGLILKLIARLPVIPFYSKITRLWLFSFSTASSAASIPVTLDVVENDLGVSKRVSAFTVPLGATINMDGTAIMQGVATAFIAQYYGIDIGITGDLTVIATATLASVGTAAVPGVGLITLSLVLVQVGLPVEGIGLIIAVDRLLDMMRTSVNVTGDSLASVLIAKTEDLFDKTRYCKS